VRRDSGGFRMLIHVGGSPPRAFRRRAEAKPAIVRRSRVLQLARNALAKLQSRRWDWRGVKREKGRARTQPNVL